MQCLTCKTEVPETSRFCNGCGKLVSASGEMATVAIENGTAHGASGIVLPVTPMSSGGFITSSSDEDEVVSTINYYYACRSCGPCDYYTDHFSDFSIANI